MSLAQLVESYGYLAVFIGTFLEGESVLVLGGFLAHRGYLVLQWVILVAFIGTYAGDQFFYYLGRWRGAAILAKRPHWQLRSQKVFDLLHKHQTLVILSFRFFYGLRSVTPFVIGMSGVHPLRYLVLNGIGAVVWAITVGVLGYLLGQTIELFLEEAKKYELMILAAIILLAGAYWVYRWLKENRELKSGSGDE